MKKKIRCILILAFLFALTVGGLAFAEDGWDGFVDTSWYEAGKKTLHIADEADLAGLAAIVNGTAAVKDDFSGKTVILDNDLNLNNQEWTPVGVAAVIVNNDNAVFRAADSKGFAGTFDGGGHAVSNLKISGEKSGVGLFGFISGGAVKNLTVRGSVAGGYFCGGLAGVCGGEISDVNNEADVYGTGNYIGGICGEASGKIALTRCENTGSVSNTSNTRSSGYIAGILGRADTYCSGSIKECSNKGAVTGYQYVAGIIGGQFGDVDVAACYNTAKITGVSFGKVYLAGIAGKSGGGTITDCYNRGDLYDKHWSQGHIRAVGGIAGCEEGRNDGTLAISNCYNTGKIDFNTENMEYGSNWIYEVGNISGGNSTTSYNMMKYSGCYYLENRIAIADPTHEAYKLWADVYKADSAIWDTAYITKATEAELKGAEVLRGLGSAFRADNSNINDGYPILYWQIDDVQDAEEYNITASVVGSSAAEIVLSRQKAAAGTVVEININDIEETKTIKSVEVTDVAGKTVAVSEMDGVYSFTMPERSVNVVVTLENKVDENAKEYSLNLPADLDGIWQISADSTYLADGKVKAGATVNITVAKEIGAAMTSLNGIKITADDVQVALTDEQTKKDSGGSGYYGSYTFIMPQSDVDVTLDVEYGVFEVYSQDGMNGEPKLAAVLSRADMEQLAKEIYYSGYASDTEAFIGKAVQGITLTDILSKAGLRFTDDCTLEVFGADGMNLYYTYDYLYGSQRYYYPNLIIGADAAAKENGKTPLDAMFVLKGNVATGAAENIEEKDLDTLNAYRFAFGQTELDFNGGVPNLEAKVVDKMPKCCNKIILISNAKAVVDVNDLEIVGGDQYNAAAAGFNVLKYKAPKQNGMKYQYGAADMLWSEKYNCYLTMIPSADDTATAAAKISRTAGDTPVIAYDGDVNGKNGLHIDDVQLIYDLYTNYADYCGDKNFDIADIAARLRADYNGDGVVDMQDVQAVMNLFLNS